MGYGLSSCRPTCFAKPAVSAGLNVRLVYFRGLSECRASPWISDTAHLSKLMSKIQCQGGHTQLGRVLSDARREATASGVRAVVFVGDAMEEQLDALCAIAGELGLLKVPCFMFQEGLDPVAETAFREIARLTGGAWCRFDMGSAAQLRELLRAAAAYATGGRDALMRLAKTTSGAAMLLAKQCRSKCSCGFTGRIKSATLNASRTRQKFADIRAYQTTLRLIDQPGAGRAALSRATDRKRWFNLRLT